MCEGERGIGGVHPLHVTSCIFVEGQCVRRDCVGRGVLGERSVGGGEGSVGGGECWGKGVLGKESVGGGECWGRGVSGRGVSGERSVGGGECWGMRGEHGKRSVWGGVCEKGRQTFLTSETTLSWWSLKILRERGSLMLSSGQQRNRQHQ